MVFRHFDKNKYSNLSDLFSSKLPDLDENIAKKTGSFIWNVKINWGLL